MGLDRKVQHMIALKVECKKPKSGRVERWKRWHHNGSKKTKTDVMGDGGVNNGSIE